MQIILNGQSVSTQQTTLEDLLAEQGYADCSVATAVNTEFVPVGNRATTAIVEGCAVDVVAPMQGG